MQEFIEHRNSSNYYLSMMFVPFFYLDDIFAKQSLNPMEFEQEKHNVNKVMVNEKYRTYQKIFHYQPKHVYRINDGIWLIIY
jgi:hypothetical protein